MDPLESANMKKSDPDLAAKLLSMTDTARGSLLEFLNPSEMGSDKLDSVIARIERSVALRKRSGV
jgi:hypothetical protein